MARGPGGQARKAVCCNPHNLPVCKGCGFLAGVNCTCGIDIHAPATARESLLPLDRIPKKYRFDPQTGKKWEYRSEIKAYLRERNARLDDKSRHITVG
jgi:hypothetical protein